MIDKRLLKIASNTKFYGLKNNYTYKSNLKNSICGDKISIEISLKKNTIQELRYETEACIFCQASASTLANIAKNTNFSSFKKNLSKYLNLSKKKKPLPIHTMQLSSDKHFFLYLHLGDFPFDEKNRLFLPTYLNYLVH